MKKNGSKSEYLFIYLIIYFHLQTCKLIQCSEAVCLIWAVKKKRILHIKEKKRKRKTKVCVKKYTILPREAERETVSQL